MINEMGPMVLGQTWNFLRSSALNCEIFRQKIGLCDQCYPNIRENLASLGKMAWKV